MISKRRIYHRRFLSATTMIWQLYDISVRDSHEMESLRNGQYIHFQMYLISWSIEVKWHSSNCLEKVTFLQRAIDSIPKIYNFSGLEKHLKMDYLPNSQHVSLSISQHCHKYFITFLNFLVLFTSQCEFSLVFSDKFCFYSRTLNLCMLVLVFFSYVVNRFFLYGKAYYSYCVKEV